MEKSTADKIKENRFELLKELLLKEDRERFNDLRDELLESDKFKRKVSPVVDEKIEDLKENFPVYFGGTITETIKTQIRDSQDEVVEALYPIIGKLIKKFIIAEVSKLSDSINQTINDKFSIKHIIKRLFKGKRTDAEDVLQEVFEPIIEEVFVIEKDSGLLAGNYSRGNIADKDMVSGMLTAIKSFAEDAFSKEGQNLEDIKFENFQLSIQNFKTIYIATAASGAINRDFKEGLQDDVNSLAEIILRDRSYLTDEERLNTMIKKYIIKIKPSV
ncbi:cell envelope biogenesis protein OmpA [Polaribacter litorisediminis]|uniref:cell envelope biogenesis protein OmpA n=1 Tax=Polaribacter litorisediminis TaxID=1908341 RepID=UPI001CBDB9E9|nr:cell envelope biogenesis protein OmpA [Polaribacter litorisediminis]UAM99754.1 cell envelope biogenesis protein OmpA [Polaribacter litorisediminis]